MTFLLIFNKVSLRSVIAIYLKQVEINVIKISNINPINKQIAILINKCLFAFIYKDVTAPMYIQNNMKNIEDKT